MNITIIGMGTQGDVQPYLALGHGLQLAGHEVRLVAPASFGPAASARGLAFSPMQGSAQDAMQAPELRALVERGNPLALTRHMGVLMQAQAPIWARDGLAGAQGAELLIAGIGFLGPVLSEKLGVPLVQAHVVPSTPTAAFADPAMPPEFPQLSGLANRLSYGLRQGVMQQTFRVSEQLARTELGLTTQKRRLGRLAWSTPPTLYGVSPSVLPRPADWPANVHLTGY